MSQIICVLKPVIFLNFKNTYRNLHDGKEANGDEEDFVNLIVQAFIGNRHSTKLLVGFNETSWT